MIKNVFEYLENSVKKYPDKTFVRDLEKNYSYSTFLKSSIKIGNVIKNKIDINSPVCVFMKQDCHALLSFFGIIYAGGYYSFLNIEQSNERLQQIVDVLKPKVIITSKEYYELASKLFNSYELLLIEELLLNDDSSFDSIRFIKYIDTNPLYVNFTSGSTGIPKGIVVSHRSVIDFIENFTDIFNINSNDVIANQAPFDFDVSVKDIYSCIKTGAEIIIIPREHFSNPQKLIDYLYENKTTTMIWAVSALCLISTFHGLEYKNIPTINKIIFSGEVMPIKTLNYYKNYLNDDTLFVNVYGPTEITCNCTYHILENTKDYSNGIPIGKAFPNEDVFLLDEENNAINDTNKIGEICVRGTALALGYFCSPDQNLKSFVQNPLNRNYDEKIYKTGDLAKYDENMDLIFCGRKDFQIKHLGHRIELEEIEIKISKINDVERCCCIYDDNKKRLIAFYIGKKETNELYNEIKQEFPNYMLPNIIKKVDNFPLTKNGKVNRKELINELY